MSSSSITVRQPAVAGSFYPDSARQLDRLISEYLRADAAHAPRPKALALPHAGYVYSGSIAGTGYAQLREAADQIKKVVLLGPSHRVAFAGMALSSASAFATPLGQIGVDTQGIQAIQVLPGVRTLDAAHAQEHSLEVHLPFIQRVFPDALVIPVVVGDAPPDAVAALLQAVWGKSETVVIVSTDLSHFHDYATATRIDAATTLAIESLKDTLTPQQACGCRPMNGLLRLAKKKALTVHTLEVRNSGDTQGGRDRVVGYGAYALS